MKPGYATSEFWLACGVQITALITALGSNDTSAKIAAGITAAAAVVGYIVSRYYLKAGDDSASAAAVAAAFDQQKAMHAAALAAHTANIPGGVP